MLAGCRQTPSAEESLKLSLEYANQIQDEWYRGVALSSIAASLAEAGKLEQALSVAKEIQDYNHINRSTVLLDIAIRLAEAGKFEQALSVAKEIQDEFSKVEAFGVIVVGAAKAGKIGLASSALDTAIMSVNQIKNGPKSFFLMRIAMTSAKAGLFERAYIVANQIQDEDNIALALWDIALSASMMGKNALADSTFSHAITAANQIPTRYTKISCLNKIGVAAAKAGKAELADSMFALSIKVSNARQQKMFGVDRDIGVSMVEAGRFERAIIFARQTQDNDKASILGLIAVAALKAGRTRLADSAFANAFKIAKESQIGYQKVSTLLEVAVVAMKNGKILLADSAFATAFTAANMLSESRDWNKASALYDIAIELSEARKFEQALTVAKEIQRESSKASCLHAIAHALAEAGEFERACAIANQIKNEYWKSSTLRKIGVAAAKAMKAELADSTFAVAVAVAKEVKDEYKGIAIDEVIASLAEVGDIQQALSVAKEIQDILKQNRNAINE
jgi:tetratricopeptide (TPR) repeat protein